MQNVMFTGRLAADPQITDDFGKGNKKPIAFAPGLARPNRWCGSMEYELSNGGAIIRNVTRRDIAETIRFIPEAENPSDADLVGFQAYMNPPDVEPPAG